MDIKIWSTREAAKLLGIRPGTISAAIFENRFDPPERGPGGFFLWTEKDIRRASWIFRKRSADDILDQPDGTEITSLTT